MVGALLVSALALAQARVPILPLSEVKPGMKGYGLSVLRGETPERFDVEIIDVLQNFRPGQALILATTKHPILANAITVGGMSGSPVYLDEKLIGAYAYGWQFGKDPVVGITPIENMLKELLRPVDPRIWKTLGTLPTTISSGASKRSQSAAKGPRAALDGVDRDGDPLASLRQDAFASLREGAQKLGFTHDVNGNQLVPASTPLMLGGMTERAVELLGSEFERFGIVALQGGGGGTKKAAASTGAHYVDGGSIGVQMIRGDINATAIGTVTHVAGDRLIAFGHPMFNAGQVGMPTCTARVLHVLASSMRSFKIAEAQTPLGTLVHDRQSAIVIDQRLKADMIPLRVRIHGVPHAPRTEWNVEIANHRMMTPSLTFGAVFSALDATVSDNADVDYEIRSSVTIDGHGTVKTRDVGHASGGAADGQVLSKARMFGVLGAAYGNPFEDVRIAGMEVDIDVRFDHAVITLLDAIVHGDDVDPGSQVNVYLKLRRFGRPEETKVVTVDVPTSAAGESIEVAFEPGDDVQLDHPKPDSLDDLLRIAQSGYPSTSLVMSTRLPSQGLKLRGQIVRSLPGSVLDTLSDGGGTDRPTAFPTYERKEVPLGYVLRGSARIKLNVRKEPLRRESPR